MKVRIILKYEVNVVLPELRKNPISTKINNFK